LGWPDTEVEKYFQAAMAADRTEYEAYKAKLEYLKPEWGGSNRDMLSFAGACFQSAPTNSAVSRILAAAHWAVSDEQDHLRKPEVWTEVRAAYEKMLTQFPDSEIAHNWLARSAYIAGDHDTAAREFDAIGEDWLSDCWGDKEHFQQVRREVFAKVPDPEAVAP
jgi:hypothetical protein